MHRTTAILGSAVLLVFLLQGCSHIVEQHGGDTVVMMDSAFEPREIQVTAGTTVTWQNNAGWEHTVTSDEDLFDSGVLTPGEEFNHTFEETGDYSYHCEFHVDQGMTGTVVVVEE